MFLYHGTDELGKDLILKSQIIDNTKISEVTEFYNNILSTYLGTNIREKCIYLTGDKECADLSYDFTFKVGTDILDENYLFVADFKLLEEILCCEKKEDAQYLAKKYKDSMVSFKDFKNKKFKFSTKFLWDMEFLYFKPIHITENNLII